MLSSLDNALGDARGDQESQNRNKILALVASSRNADQVQSTIPYVCPTISFVNPCNNNRSFRLKAVFYVDLQLHVFVLDTVCELSYRNIHKSAHLSTGVSCFKYVTGDRKYLLVLLCTSSARRYQKHLKAL
jgi:hypothetical protein